MKCPTCQSEMIEQDFGSAQVDVCSSCKGIWFDIRELSNLDEAHEGSGKTLNEALNSEYHKIDDRPQLKCARCQTPMIAHNFQSQKMVTVDECYGCGSFFLDAGELEIVRTHHMTDEERNACIEEMVSEIPGTQSSEVKEIIPGTESRRKAAYNLVNSICNLN